MDINIKIEVIKGFYGYDDNPNNLRYYLSLTNGQKEIKNIVIEWIYNEDENVIGIIYDKKWKHIHANNLLCILKDIINEKQSIPINSVITETYYDGNYQDERLNVSKYNYYINESDNVYNYFNNIINTQKN